MKPYKILLFLALLLPLNLVAQTNILPLGSFWKYLDNGTNQGTAWRATSYDDSGWKTGAGKFGYGLNGITTQISFGPDLKKKYATSYFRTSIDITEVFASFTASVYRDDGVVVYVNGVEVFRNNMPTGTITHTTLASSASDNGSQAQNFTIIGSAFTSGTNVIAVEVHQSKLNASDSDMAFDMELTGIPPDVTAPALQSIRRHSPSGSITDATTVTFRATFSEGVTGVDSDDFSVTILSGELSGVVSGVSAVNGSIYDITVSPITGDGELRLDLKADGTGIADETGNAINGGFSSGESYTIQQVPVDQTPPTVQSISRHSPSSSTTDATSVTFRATFSEAVSGVDASDFKLNLSGGLTAAVSSVTTVGTDGSTYDITVSPITGDGELRLDLKPGGTEIADAAGNAISGGFSSGESYTIQPASQVTQVTGFTSVTPLIPFTVARNTAEKPQSKVWIHAGKHWTVMPNASGTHIWRLDGTSWTNVYTLVSSSSTRADCKVVGNVVHVLLFRGSSMSYLVSAEYVPATNSYKAWSQRSSRSEIVMDSEAETATLDIDGTGRMWVAYESTSEVKVRWSNSPYTTWSAPIILASGITDDDICAVIAMPGKTGVLWSNQSTKRFGFRTHADSDPPSMWSADEVPASQSALDVRNGMADDHLNMAVASDGTLYCAVKTGYDIPEYAKIALLVRRPSGAWDGLYTVTEEDGTRGIVILNEATGKLRVVYTIDESGGDILYRESSTTDISFSSAITLISGVYSNASSIKANHGSEVVILASNSSQVVSVLATDAGAAEGLSASSVSGATAAEAWAVPEGDQFKAYPNPVSSSATIRFVLPEDGEYTLVLYDSKGAQTSFIKQGVAVGGEEQAVTLNSGTLQRGLYIIRLQTGWDVKTLKLVVEK